SPVLYTLSLHDALPILVVGDDVRVGAHIERRVVAGVRSAFFARGACRGQSWQRLRRRWRGQRSLRARRERTTDRAGGPWNPSNRSEEHTSELQSLRHLV